MFNASLFLVKFNFIEQKCLVYNNSFRVDHDENVFIKNIVLKFRSFKPHNSNDVTLCKLFFFIYMNK